MRVLFLLLALVAMSVAHCAPGDLGVGSLLVGKQMLVVGNARQMTLKSDGNVTDVSLSPDGKCAVYSTDSHGMGELRLLQTSTGKATTIITLHRGVEITEDELVASGEIWTMRDEAVGWSPDSKLFLFNATRHTLNAKGQLEKEHVIVYTADGQRRASYAPTGEATFESSWAFSPDRRKVAFLLFDYSVERAKVIVLDIATGRSTVPLQPKSETSYIADWTKAGVECVAYTDDGDEQTWIIPLDGDPKHVLVTKRKKEAYMLSPDGRFGIGDGSGKIGDGAGLTLLDQKTGKAILITSDGSVAIESWAPNSKALFYSQFEYVASADSKIPVLPVRSLWLSSVLPGKLNHVRIAAHYDGSMSCSDDCSRIAYVSQGQLYIAELSLRAANSARKVSQPAAHRR